MPGGILAADRLSAGYATGKPVLRDVSFAVQPGELVGLIGPNGAGKSTLLKTLRGLLTPLGGTVAINGEPTDRLTDREFAHLAAYLQQTSHITFGYSVREMVTAGRYSRLRWWQREGERDKAVVNACLEYTGVLDLAERSIHEISGGQRQRALLAKALVQQTPLLFLDEPATGLDIFYQEEIFRFCRELCAAGKTILMVVHELSLAARFCSRLLLIADGGIVADGTPAGVLTAANMGRAYKATVRVVVNPLTGTLEVFTESSARDARREALLATILERDGHA